MRTTTVVISLGTSKAGLTDLRVQPLTAAGVATGGVITAGMVEQGRGMYLWSGGVPDDAAAVRVTSAGVATALDVVVIPPSAGTAGGDMVLNDSQWRIG